MAYCSLEEAWGNEFADLYKESESMPNEKDHYLDENILKERDITTVSIPTKKSGDVKDIKGYYLDNKPQVEFAMKCEKFMEHFVSCKECRGKIKDMLDDYKKETQMIEKFSPASVPINNNYLDIFVLIITGVFIIFVLDCFVRLGKRFGK